jgi:transposase-like protein
MRRQVEAARCGGASVEAIARAFRVSPATLRRSCAEELAIGWARRRATILEMLFRAASKGSVAAMKHLDKLMSKRS